MNLRILNIQICLRIYVALALAAASVFSTLALSFVPLILLMWYLVQWRWPFSPLINLLTQYFMFFSLNLLFIPVTGPYWPLLISLPVLLLVDRALKKSSLTAPMQETHFKRRPTNLSITLGAIDLAVLLVSAALSVITLLAASILVILYLISLIVVIIKYFPSKPVAEEPINLRVVAGRSVSQETFIKVITRIGSRLFLISREPWLKVTPIILSLQEEKVTTQISMTPTLSGPTNPSLEGYALDQWGLVQIRFTLQPINLIVIPRARYAEWVANKYLQGTKPGELPLIANVSAMQPGYGLRRGIEYYGNRMYQPGDSLRNMDWKHSYKYNELIVKEYTEFHGQAVIILINLISGNDDQKDILAFNILSTAITMAQENAPVVLTAYSDQAVVMTTGTLHGQQIILRALQILKNIIVREAPEKYLEPPNVRRLKANIHRMQGISGKPAGVLGELLQMEYKSLSHNSQNSPFTLAYNQAMSGINQQATVIVISQHNHDAEDLAFYESVFSRKGIALIYI
jgi:uncharacterized protein (DUF58 family)